MVSKANWRLSPRIVRTEVCKLSRTAITVYTQAPETLRTRSSHRTYADGRQDHWIFLWCQPKCRLVMISHPSCSIAGSDRDKFQSRPGTARRQTRSILPTPWIVTPARIAYPSAKHSPALDHSMQKIRSMRDHTIAVCRVGVWGERDLWGYTVHWEKNTTMRRMVSRSSIVFLYGDGTIRARCWSCRE